MLYILVLMIKEIKANYALQPGIFFVSKANLQRYDMTTFESVQFRGGTLNNLYNNTAVRASFDENEKVFKREYDGFRPVSYLIEAMDEDVGEMFEEG